MKRTELLALAERFEHKWWAAPESDEIALSKLAAFVRQIAEAQPVAWLRGDSCPDHSVRWAQCEVRCWRAPQWTDDLRRSELDAAIDAALEQAK